MVDLSLISEDKWYILGNDPCAIFVLDKWLLQGVDAKGLSYIINGWMLKMHPFHLWRAKLPNHCIIKSPETPPDFIKRKLIYVIVTLGFE